MAGHMDVFWTWLLGTLLIGALRAGISARGPGIHVLRPVHLRCSLGWNSEQGEGDCIWAKVSLSGWRSPGYREEKGAGAASQGWG